MKKQFPVTSKPSHRLQPLGPPPSVADETDLLFPDLKASPVEPKLRPPAEYLGRNPYSELKRRAEHAQHLAAMDSETHAKIKEAQALLAARRVAQDALIYPSPSALTDEEARGGSVVLTAAEERRAALPPLRAVATPPQYQQQHRSLVAASSSSGDRAVSPLSPVVSLVSPLKRTTSPYWSSNGVTQSSGVAYWAQECAAIRPPMVTAADAKSSKSQLSKHKVGKHTGYFGEELLTASAKRIRKDETGGEEDEGEGGGSDNPRSSSPNSQPQQPSPLSFSGRVLTFTEPAERLLSLHPSTSTIDVCSNAQWTLDAFSVVDAAGLAMLFGKASIPMIRVNAQLHRNSEACPKGNPAADPPAFLPDLRATIYGKPSAYWPGDAVTAELYLSRYAYTCKYAKIATSCKSYPNVFSQFGVDGEALELVSPFPLRFLPGATSTAAQDAVELSLTYHAKTRLRVLRSAFPLPLFQGLVPCDAVLCVSGAPSSPPSSASAASRTSHITVELQLSIPDHVENFYFKSAAANLAFFDALDGTQRTFRLVQQQTPFSTTATPLLLNHSTAQGGGGGHPNATTPSTPYAKSSQQPSPALESRNDISFVWNVLRVPLMLKLFDQDPTLLMAGRLTHETSYRGIVLRSPSPSERSCTLWNFIKLQQLVAFIECIEGVTHFGVECVAEMDVSSGGASAEKTRLRFKGRLCAVISESAKALFSDSSSLRSNVAIPSTHYHFTGSLEENAWNYVGGCTFAFLKAPTLHFAVDAATLLPRDIRIGGSPVLQMGDEGVGYSSEHGYNNNSNSGGSAPAAVTAFAVFPIDSIPNYVFAAPVAGTSSSAVQQQQQQHSVSLKRIVQSLLHPSALTHSAVFNRDAESASKRRIPLNFTERVVGILQAADRVHLHDAFLVINDSPDELIISTTQNRRDAPVDAASDMFSFASSSPRYAPGTRIVVNSATVWVHGAPCSAAGVITLTPLRSQSEGDENHSSSSAAVQLDAVLQLQSNLLSAHGGALSSVGCSSVAGVGPQWRLRLLIPSGSPSLPPSVVTVDSETVEGEFQSIPQAPPTNIGQPQAMKKNSLTNYWDADEMVHCNLQHALATLSGGGGTSLPLMEYSIAIHGPSSNNGEELVACRIAALCIPPRIQLEHRPHVLQQSLHAFSHGGGGGGTGSRSIQDALSATYDIQLCLRTSAGTLFTSDEVPSPRAIMQQHQQPSLLLTSQPLWEVVDSNVNMKLKCGIFEALRDAFFGKVAEFRSQCLTNRRQWVELHDASTSALEALQIELAYRQSVVEALNADTTSLATAISCATTEASLLAHYCRMRVAASSEKYCLSSMADEARRGARADAADAQQQTSKYQDAVLLHHLKDVGAASSNKLLAASKFTTVSSALSLMSSTLDRSLRSGVWRVLEHYQNDLVNPYRSSNVASSAASPHSVAEGNASVFAHLSVTHLHHTRTTLQHAAAMVEAFTTITQQLEADEVVFPSLFALHDVSLTGGQRSRVDGLHRCSSALSLSLVVGGVLRGHIFRTQATLAALDHLSVVSSIDKISSDMLKMYLSLLRFQQS